MASFDSDSFSLDSFDSDSFDFGPAPQESFPAFLLIPLMWTKFSYLIALFLLY
jgi:hypothetical protein